MRVRNIITQLVDETENVVDAEEGPVAIATSYFRQIFESSNPEDIVDALSKVSTTITQIINEDLAPITEWEIKPTLFAMHPEKTLWPDGMTALFHQKFWNIVKKNLTRMVNQFLFEGTVTNGIIVILGYCKRMIFEN